jgi:UDP-N-acetylmuramate-alanine ligase
MNHKVQYELSAEWPHQNRNQWLATLFRYVDNDMQIAVTGSHGDLAVLTAQLMETMAWAIEELEGEGQMLLSQTGDLVVTYGPAVIS